MRGSGSIILYIVCFKLILDSTEAIESFRPGHRLNATAFRNISGLDIAACKFECQSRRKCESYNYYRHVKLCSLLGSNSSSAETVRDPKVTYGEKQTRTEQSVAPTCDKQPCNDKQTCRLEGNTSSCRIEECGSPYELGENLNLHRNMRNICGKISYELACYEVMSKEGMKNFTVFRTCAGESKWEAPIISCYKNKCESPYELGDILNLRGNMRNIGSKISYELAYYDIVSKGTKTRTVISTCMEDGKWLAPCHENITHCVIYEGCFVDNDTRVLNGTSLKGIKNMTIPFCANHCFENNSEHFGVEYGKQCYCGTSFTDLGQSDKCYMPCAGDNSTLCGGEWAIDIYTYKDAMHNACDSK